MKQLSVLLGVFNYEFRMQIRRPAIWIITILLECLFVSLFSRGSATYITALLAQNSLLYVLAYWTFTLNRLLPVGVGVLLADRLPRDRRTKVDELFTSMPGSLSARLVGKYLGSLLATLIPMLAFYALGVGYVIYRTGNLMAIPLGLETFAVITLPGMLFISAFSLACPAVLWVPLYQFCFVGYWFWGNELNPTFGIPTLSGTILTPIGGFVARGIFGYNETFFKATPMQGIESILVLVGCAIFMLFVLWSFLRWQQVRQ